MMEQKKQDLDKVEKIEKGQPEELEEDLEELSHEDLISSCSFANDVLESYDTGLMSPDQKQNHMDLKNKIYKVLEHAVNEMYDLVFFEEDELNKDSINP